MNPPESILRLLQRGLDEYLDLDPDAASGLSDLEGRVIAVEISGLEAPVFLHVEGGRIRVSGDAESEPDTRLRGGPLSMARMVLSSDSASPLFSGSVEIFGDTETGQRLRDILQSVRIDWEELISRATGDMVARQVTRAGEATREWARRSASSLEQDLADFAQEESRILPHPLEVSEFVEGVDDVRDRLARAQARVARLESTLAGDDDGHDAN